MKNENLIDFLLEHNKKQSEEFSGPDAALSRKIYRAEHPTEIAALKCMDGRLHLPIITKTPLGMIRPFRNLGGQFDLGWPFFGLLVKEWVEHSISRGRNCIVLTTYHYSKSDQHLGCRGFNYDTNLARTETIRLKEQFERVFGKLHSVVYPIVLGIETDEDALILHGENGELLDLSKITEVDVRELRIKIGILFPDMRPRMADDLLPLLIGNIEHIKEMKEMKRQTSDINHRESVLGVGRGFDWLHLHNKALIVGPFSYNLREPIGKAAGILLDNLKQGRIDEKDGIVLMISAVYRKKVDIDYQLAQEKAISLAELSVRTIKEEVPELVPYLTVLVGTVDMNTLYFNRIPYIASK